MSHEAASKVEAADLRAQRARHQVPIYVLAPRVGIHPAELGAVLNGRRALRPELAQRIMTQLEAIARERRTGQPTS